MPGSRTKDNKVKQLLSTKANQLNKIRKTKSNQNKTSMHRCKNEANLNTTNTKY